MATDIDTALAGHESPTREATRPPQAAKPSRGRGVFVAWAAVVAACVAVAALAFAVLRGDDDDAPTPAFPSASALERQAELERQAHLEGQQRTYGGSTPPFPSASALERQAELERQAHLEGQQRTYGGANTADDQSQDPGSDDFVPGSRRMPTG